jgi:hypothetical protein
MLLLSVLYRASVPAGIGMTFTPKLDVLLLGLALDIAMMEYSDPLMRLLRSVKSIRWHCGDERMPPIVAAI